MCASHDDSPNNKQRKVHLAGIYKLKSRKFMLPKVQRHCYFASSSGLLSYCPLLPIRHITYVFDISFWVI